MQQAIGNVTCSNGPWWLNRLVFKLKKKIVLWFFWDQRPDCWSDDKCPRAALEETSWCLKVSGLFCPNSSNLARNKKCKIFPLYAALPRLQADSSLLWSVVLDIKVRWFQKWHKKRANWTRLAKLHRIFSVT